MFSEQTIRACINFPANNQERFLIYPALAIYSPIENLVKTVVGVIFTGLSLMTLGLSPPINNVANWTRHSRGIFSIPAQILGNIFKINSEILTTYNTTDPHRCYLRNVLIAAVREDKPEEVENLVKNYKDINCFTDIGLTKAQWECANLFRRCQNNKIQVLAKHIIFRAYSIVNLIASSALLGIAAPIVGICCIPFALYHRKEKKYTELPLVIPKIPYLVHYVCLAARMVVNPLQFADQAIVRFKDAGSPQKKSTILAALEAPTNFWKNALEIR